MTISLAINGAFGKMGELASDVFAKHKGFDLVARLGRHDDFKSELEHFKPDVVLDLTVADAAFDNAKIIIDSGARPVIGTSGLKQQDVEKLKDFAKEKSVAGIVVPNFSIGVVMMLEFSKIAARYFSDVEIIEKHHQTKKDAPSGTAMHTAELIQAEQDQEDIPIHSIRLPGFLAHQEVLFGGKGEVLTLKHDVLSRDCYVKGMILACQKVMELSSLELGLESVL